MDDVEGLLAALDNEEYGRSARMGTIFGVLPPGVTCVLRIHEEAGADGTTKTGELRIARVSGEESVDALQFALVVEGHVESEPDDDEDDEDLSGDSEADSARPQSELVFQRELILLRPRPFAERGRVGLFVHSPFRSSPAAALAIVVEVQRVVEWTDDERVTYEKALADCVEDLANATEEVRQREERASKAELIWPGLARALEELRSESRRRAALMFVGRATGARLTEDVALSASDEFTATVVEAVQQEIRLAAPTNESALAWLLTRATYKVLAAALTEQRTTMDVDGLLALHAGEVGRHGAVLSEVVNASTGLDDFEAQLKQENLTFLEDISPASRARAYRWLRARGLEPAGYDPLGSVKKRRAALENNAEEKSR